MSVIETFERLRKAPVSVRQRFVGTVAITIMAVTAFVWLIFFWWNISQTDFSLPAFSPDSDTHQILPPYSQ
ncbi:hypothetical protein A2841_02530 [Candidatus Kaiserbacteria bacterium RIFCSPHIGHO2_01_FULL_48_10]|uniref:Uncharacterized protein n=1 Tax=Candidatus Kaiserbacteria bacterium RIFCSPHIGHO2_01_FULL_48_10 TaxID=1798476 RepID=A0A1F6C2Q0_9BACT|nr:MAG: hypothetical protein A2841_02530 [Candidatus Kaiserbacteria bacterium RIFCSPHIGHO2_01_FULL_48_10]